MDNKKGRVFKHLRPKECVECKKALKLGYKALHVDCRIHTENGWLPLIDDKDNHYFWIFCSRECLRTYVDRSLQNNDNMGA
jgi:hypothetical protein